MPQATYVASSMQKWTLRITVGYVIDANIILKELRDPRPIILYKKPPLIVRKWFIATYSDAAFNVTKSSSYGQTRFVSGLQFDAGTEEGDIYHVIDLCSSKQRRVIYSSYGAEIFACTYAGGRVFHIKQAFKSFSPMEHVPYVLCVDSKGLYDTTTTFHEGNEYRIKQAVRGIRDYFESGELDVLMWVEGRFNIADALTKMNNVTHRLLNRVISTGRLDFPAHRSFELCGNEWK